MTSSRITGYLRLQQKTFLKDLAASEAFFYDGTFYTCPSLFYQISTIHIMTDDQMTPVVYALLPGKDQTTYTRLFTLLSEKK